MSRVALVTGGSRGIGRAISMELAARGNKVAVNYARRRDTAAEVVDEILSRGGTAEAFRADVSLSDEVTGLFARIRQRWGRPDILINNVGITADSLLARLDEPDWERVMNVNLRSAYLCSKAALRGMLRGRWGRIVSVGSVAGLAGNPGQTSYAASKAALVGFSKSLAKEVGVRGITVNVVAPGFVLTDLTSGLGEEVMERVISRTSLRRLGRPEEVASAVAYLASDEASYITGHVLVIDGGLAL